LHHEQERDGRKRDFEKSRVRSVGETVWKRGKLLDLGQGEGMGVLAHRGRLSGLVWAEGTQVSPIPMGRYSSLASKKELIESKSNI